VEVNGDTYQSTDSQFDDYDYPTRRVETNSFSGTTRTQITAYDHKISPWVLGQASSTSVNGIVTSSRTYDALAQLTSQASFGLTTYSFNYHANGLMQSAYDGLGHGPEAPSYHRGIATRIDFADGTFATQGVNDLGEVTSITDERGSTTSYGRDNMGRLTQITYPSNDEQAWTARSFSYQTLTAPELGIPAGSWRMQVSQGKYRKRIYFDALLRPVLEEEKDTNSGVTIYRNYEYDPVNRENFTSYPSTDYSETDGMVEAYDELGRLWQRRTQDDAVLETVEYLSGNKKRITDAEGYQTTITYQAFGEPDYGKPTRVQSPEGQTTVINRDIFGNITNVTQSGSYGGGTVSATQSWTYDSHKRLCRKTEPETGSTVFGYDEASRIVWQIKGQSGSGCVTNRPSGATQFQYDARNRPTMIDYAGTGDDVTYGYDASGNLTSVVNATVSWSYEYNRRNLLKWQSASIDDQTFLIDPVYDGLAHLSAREYPSGRSVSYAPDAWGRPTQLGSWVSGVDYHPNGLPSDYALGNGLSYSQTLNARRWPAVQWTQDGSATVQKFTYDYNDSADLIGITDGTDAADSVWNLDYDGLHRLTAATGVWGSYGYTYDPLNNLRSRTGPNSLNYSYNSATNRVSSISGSQSRSYGYNAQGQVTADGQNTYTWNEAERIIDIPGKASYGYDGHGKRIKIEKADGTVEYNLYDLAGELVYVKRIEPDPLALARAGHLAPDEPVQTAEIDAGLPAPDDFNLGASDEPLLASSVGDYNLGDHGYRFGTRPKARLFNAATNPPRVPDELSPGDATAPGPTLTSTTVNFSWSESSGTVNYVIRVYNDDTNTLVVDASPTSPSYQATLEYGVHYRWWVRACGPVACSGFSDRAYFSTLSTPDTPSNPSPGSLTAPGGVTPDWTVTFSWIGSSGATSYWSYVTDVSTGTTESHHVSGTSYTDILYDGRAYSWTVKACNAAGCSDPTDARYFTTPASGSSVPATPTEASPGGPTSPGPTVASSDPTFNWSASSGASYYTLHIESSDGGISYTHDLAETNFHGLDFRENLQLSWSVKACNSQGCSSPTATLYFVIPSNEPPPSVPATPSNPTPGSTNAPGATTESRNVTLNWSIASGATSYTVQVFNNSTGATVINTSISGTSYAASLDYASPYRWTVKACNAAGCSAATASRYFETPPVPTIESETDYLSLGGQTLVELVKVGGTTTPSYLHPDLLGSPHRKTDANGDAQWREHYDPYGMKLNGVAEKVGYTGHAYDSETGLTYMQARFYDPLVGRFLSTDPVGFDAGNPYGFNRYSYANNNPYKYTDPFGLESDGVTEEERKKENRRRDERNKSYCGKVDFTCGSTYVADGQSGRFKGSSGRREMRERSRERSKKEREDDENWKLSDTVNDIAGQSIANVHTGRELRIEMVSVSIGADGFVVLVDSVPLKRDGSPEPIHQSYPYAWDSYSAHPGLFHSSIYNLDAGYDSRNGFLWRVEIPPQAQTHNNSAGHSVNIYVRP